jgi:peptidoglycan/LPS O-acetylase OafA/YrhL
VTAVAYGIAAFLVALAIPPTLRLSPLFAHLARLSLGLYVVHLLFLDLAAWLIGRATLAACLVVALLAVVASALYVLAFDRLPFRQRLIRQAAGAGRIDASDHRLAAAMHHNELCKTATAVTKRHDRE